MTDLTIPLSAALRGRYLVERELGRGGMATVYLARDLRHDRPVALKVLNPELVPQLGAERFVREIRVAARLHHPHILPLFDSGEAGGLLWYTMPYVEGETLRQRLVREGRLAPAEALEIARQVGSALDYAHRQGVLHRDIKPANILLHEGGALVADFGIARALDAAGGDDLTRTGLIVGTPAYMSPEQAEGERELDGRCDLYALGSTLFEMLAGSPPFTGPTAGSIIIRRVTQDPPSVRALRPELPPALDRALLKALARSPAERFETAAAFLSAAGSAAPAPAAPASPGPRSIAVLPFTNLSPDPENEFFTDGMTDELINALAKVEGLHVVSRTSAFAFKGTSEDVRAVGTRLGVGAVLEGSVRRAGRRLRLGVQLVDVASGFQLWSESYDRELEDVFAIQNQISRAIVATLQVKLLGAAASTLVRPATADLEAYTIYLKGRQALSRRTAHDITGAAALFQEALRRDPDYAPAHAGLADAHVLLGFYCAVPPREAFERSRASALRALGIEPELADAHRALAYVAMYADWDWDAAEREFQLALHLNPGNATAHQWYGNYLAILGRFEPALASFQRAVTLDPLSALTHAGLGWGYFFARQYDLAVDACGRAIEIDPAFPVAHWYMAMACEQTGRLEEAEQAQREAVRLNPRDLGILACLAAIVARRGDAVTARELLSDLRGRREQEYVSPYDLALVHCALGETAQALDWLEQGYGERTHRMAFLGVDPRLDPLRGEPRFAALLERMAFR